MSAAFVAVTVHEPADVADNAEPDTEHPAVPALVTAYETAPEPEPPELVNDNCEPYVTEVELTINDVCVTPLTGPHDKPNLSRIPPEAT